MSRSPSSSSSSSSSGLPSPPSSPSSSPSSASPSAAPSSSAARSSLPQRRTSHALDRRRHGKPARERHPDSIPKPFSEPIMFTMKDIRIEEEEHGEDGCPGGLHRRCMTHADLSSSHGWPSHPAPDLLHLFNIFQFNKPEKPAARMLINVTLVGNIQPVRLLVAYDASVQDVIDSALKAYAKEGRLTQNINKAQNYGLHYSPFCLESIDPTECMSAMGTRNFYLFPSSIQPTNPSEGYDETKPWWNIFRSILS